MGTGVQPSLWGRLGELTMPTLLLAGEQDAKFTAINREMARCCPTRRWRSSPGQGIPFMPSSRIAIIKWYWIFCKGEFDAAKRFT